MELQLLLPFFSPSLLPSLAPLSSVLPDYVILRDGNEVQFEKLVSGAELSPSILKGAILVGSEAFPLPKLSDLRGEGLWMMWSSLYSFFSAKCLAHSRCSFKLF